MTGKRPPESQAGTQNTVPNVPLSSPDRLATPQHGHDFTLQAVMEMQRTLGELVAEVRGLAKANESSSRKLDEVMKWKTLILGGTAVASVVGVALIGVLGYVATKVIDRYLPPMPAAQIAPAPLQPAPAILPAPAPPAPRASGP